MTEQKRGNVNLVVVESPAKGRTIEKYLGPGYKVLASFGHLKDLPQKEFGVEIKDKFKPQFIIPYKSKKTISLLKKAAQSAKNVYLATDFDREGEAIAFQIFEVLNSQPKNTQSLKDKFKRITFTEITKDAIKSAVKNPRNIDLNLVSAQHARRVLDRIVGYKLSPLLWKKVAQGLSAGRVQSPALKLIVDREREIEKFIPEEYWTIKAILKKQSTDSNKQPASFEALLIENDGKPIEKMSIKNKRDAEKLLDELKNTEYIVLEKREYDRNINPPAPFITSTLQREAHNQFGFSAKRTMFLAQRLYEQGLITYHRTDSTNLSSFALNLIRDFIKSNYGLEYLSASSRIYKTKVKRAQEAHEAIRPTHIRFETKTEKEKLEADEQRLFDLIFNRAIASQMRDAIIHETEAKIKAAKCIFRAHGQGIKFDGFLKIYPMKIGEYTLPPLSQNEILDLVNLLKEQHFTEPPPRYNEASLIKELEKEGIGRPSTYAVILDTIKARGYVEKIKQYLKPQDVGVIVSDLLSKHFKDIVDSKFTAAMEKELDDIAEGETKYEDVCEHFWQPFSKNLAKKEKELKKEKIVKDEKTNEICEKCGAKMVIKLGRFGKFLSCSKFPECKNAKPYFISLGQCPECKKGEMVERHTRKGKVFWGCSRYPKCKWATWDKPSEIEDSK